MAAAGTAIAQRTERRSSVGTMQSNQMPMRTPLSEVDHGSDAATATAHQSAACAKRARSNMGFQGLAVATGCIVMLAIAGSASNLASILSALEQRVSLVNK